MIDKNMYFKVSWDQNFSDLMMHLWAPVNHSMKINAEALINLARKRLCLTSHEETVYIMNMIKEEIAKVNHNLGQMLVPNCVYRNGLCKEIKSKNKCLNGMMKKYSYYRDLFITDNV